MGGHKQALCPGRGRKDDLTLEVVVILWRSTLGADAVLVQGATEGVFERLELLYREVLEQTLDLSV